jgi:hypothetical protein
MVVAGRERQCEVARKYLVLWSGWEFGSDLLLD